jgi:hypothetical protein
MTKVLDDPTTYGFPNATCISNTCIWYDNYHPTSAFMKLQVEDMQTVLSALGGW